EQPEDLALPDVERHSIRRGEGAEALREVAARYGDIEIELDVRDAFCERRVAARSAAEKVDECILEARRHRRQHGAGGCGEMLQAADGAGVRPRSRLDLGDDDTDGLALYHTVADARLLERSSEQRTAVAARPMQLKRPLGDPVAKLRRRPAELDAAVV